MIVLLDTSHDLDVCQQELGCEVGQLLTPLTGFRLRDPSRPWAIDNGAFSGFDEKKFFSRLKRSEKYDRTNCKFVCSPDVVADAETTGFWFACYYEQIAGKGWPIAYVLQDGQEKNNAVPIPWHMLDAIFIGGTNKFKGCGFVIECVQEARRLKKWSHAGRVNTPNRFEYFERMGVTSCDGSGIAQYSDMREAIARRADQGVLNV